MKSDREKAKKHLEKIREIVRNNPTPIFKMSKEEVINKLRKTREKIWEEKIGLSFRR